IRDATLQERLRHVPPAEAIVEVETQRFVKDWARRRIGPVVERLIEECDAKRHAIVSPLLEKLNGKLTEAERKYLEKAFQRLQNPPPAGPMSARREEVPQEEGGGGHPLLGALRNFGWLREWPLAPGPPPYPGVARPPGRKRRNHFVPSGARPALTSC